MTSALAAAAIAGIASIGGCMVGPDYRRPELSMPGAFRTLAPASAEETSIADLAWWEVFDDPTLVALIDEALRNNRDLKAAVARIAAAQGVRAQARAPLFPQVGYGGGVSRGRNEAFGAISPNAGATESTAFVDLNVAWELDLWGRVRRSDEAALALILQTEEARRGLMLLIVSEVAADWFTLIGLDRQIAVSKQSVRNFGDSETLFRERADGGVGSDLPVLRAQALKSQAAAAVPELERRLYALENALCTLVGRPPGSILRDASLPSIAPPEIPAGVPSELLERRPDVRQAEAAVMQNSALIGVATAEFFPRIGLTTILGRASPDLSDFSSGTWNLWSIAAQLAGPLFTGGFLTGQLDQAKAQWVESVAQYEQVVLSALADTSTALIDRTKIGEAIGFQRERVAALEKSVQMSLLRFDLGRASYYEVLEAQQQLFPAQLVVAELEADELVSFARIYRALGGGWRTPAGEWVRPDPAAAPEASTTAARSEEGGRSERRLAGAP
ncbi:MAG TPA: efflux transporter outer membrane subunit [Phycisphaerales bacterium]|nr:efflux transporter outer membrane subunit [Phycisphaerales bacterium]HMP38118.1 efflux transporter outer membrane subunit [Phycisphaerales bacterium]